MARSRVTKGRTQRAKPGRESTHTKRAPRAVRDARKVDKRLVRDRVDYLKSNAIQSKTFRTRAEAIEFASTQMLENGIDYDVPKRGRTARLVSIDANAVAESSEMKRIRHDLRTRSRSATGKRARALEALGRRENFFDWPVGETPS